MSTNETVAFQRWLLLTLARIVPAAGAVLGVVLAGRAVDMPTKLLGVGIVVSALLVLATLPRHLARRWRSR
ncbi:hypothetical protein SAMN05192583_2655 [Sphingomonas gellani]|uniref:Uncharacterized protein n=1 Tax=Sphingomonas gellani TaxID=1166340 RepID=A0A1H8G359_9SPHN|nr:hypothetical protein [Sphingomonas gellani]SEN37718.1 hypothetical protein SAMN05192583_2655 [Sphingomonas gellani]